jgi:O-antigen ligase
LRPDLQAHSEGCILNARLDTSVEAPRAAARAVATVACVLLALAFLTNFTIYQDTVKGNAIFGRAYVLPVLFLIPLLALRPAAALRIFREPVFWWFSAYVGLGVVWLLLLDPGDVAQQQWQLRMLAWVHFSAICILLLEARRGVIALVIVGCIALAALFNYVDVIIPYRFVPKGFPGSTPERGAGLFMNANIAAAFVLTATIAALPYVPMRFRAVIMVLAVAGVAPCFSRFGFTFVVLLVLMAMFLRVLNRVQVLLVLLSIPVMIAALGLYYQVLLSGPETNVENIQNRLAWFESLGRGDDESVEGRADAALRAWDMFMDDPLLGHGIGATSHAIQVLGTHNMYLMLMAEQGIFGLGLYLSLILMLAWRGWALRNAAAPAGAHDAGAALLMFAAFLAAYGLSNHNVLEEPQTIFLLAFVVAAGFHEHGLADQFGRQAHSRERPVARPRGRRANSYLRS